MKKIILAMVVAIMAAVNVSFALQSDKSVIDLSLTDIMALAIAENDAGCAICGQGVDDCSCTAIGITCPYGSCWGTWCHELSGDLLCRCKANGSPYSVCI
jgi:hypothetical protein